MEYKISDFLKIDDEVDISDLYFSIKNNTVFETNMWVKIDDNLYFSYFHNGNGTGNMYYGTPIYQCELIGININMTFISREEVLKKLLISMRPYKLQKLKDRINGKHEEIGEPRTNTERVL